jgi:membrane protease YdiL (CAAX protease family)
LTGRVVVVTQSDFAPASNDSFQEKYMRSDSSSPSRHSAFIDLLIVFIPIGIFILALDAINSEWYASVGRVALTVLTLWVIHRRGGGWHTLGLVRPANIVKTIALGIGLMVLGIFVTSTAREVLVRLPGMTLAEADISRFANLQGNLPLLLSWLVAIWTTVAFGEELIYRAFLLDRLRTIFNRGRSQIVLAVLLSAAVFGFAHSYQGTMGIILTGLIGLIYLLAYLLSGRNLWMLVIAHGLTDSLSLSFIYLGRM